MEKGGVVYRQVAPIDLDVLQDRLEGLLGKYELITVNYAHGDLQGIMRRRRRRKRRMKRNRK